VLEFDESYSTTSNVNGFIDTTLDDELLLEELELKDDSLLDDDSLFEELELDKFYNVFSGAGEINKTLFNNSLFDWLYPRKYK
jgi:hypothetical protein